VIGARAPAEQRAISHETWNANIRTEALPLSQPRLSTAAISKVRVTSTAAALALSDRVGDEALSGNAIRFHSWFRCGRLRRHGAALLAPVSRNASRRTIAPIVALMMRSMMMELK